MSSSTSECTLELDALDLLRLHALLAQLARGVDARVDHDAAGERLVGVERDLEALAELVGDLVPVALGRDDLRVAARRLERARAGGEAVAARAAPTSGRRARRAPGMERLGHGAELLAQADRLRGRDAQRHRRLLLVELEQARAAAAAPSMPVEPVMCQPRS